MEHPSHDAFGGDASDDGTSNRNDARDSLFLMADLYLPHAPAAVQVRVRNLSVGGLMADYPRGLEIGLPVGVDLRGIGRVEGQVAWSTAGRIGIAFERTIDPMAARKPVGTRAKGTVSVKPLRSRR